MAVRSLFEDQDEAWLDATGSYRVAQWLLATVCLCAVVEWFVLSGGAAQSVVTVTGMVVAVLAAVGLLMVSHRRVDARVGAECERADATRQDLETAVERLRSIFELHPEAVFAFDTVGRFTAANAASSRVTGVQEVDLVGHHFSEVIDPRHHEALTMGFAQIAARETVQVQLELRSASGELVDLDVTGLPIMVGESVVGCYAIAADATGRRQLKRDLMRAQLEAEHANEAKSLFLTNVSHEIRSPLTTMLGNFEMLQDTELDAVQLRFVENMNRSGERLLSLVTDILDFSRMESGSLALVHHATDLQLVIREAITIATADARDKGLEVRCDVDPDIPRSVMADSARLAQILTSLLDNAVKFTDEGWVRAAVAVVHDTPDVARVRFSISDSGIGVSEAQQFHIFRAFHQVDPTATRRHGGTGLGLASCRRLVEMMGGQLTATSEPGQGATFTFTLDLAHAHARPTAGNAIQGNARVAQALTR